MPLYMGADPPLTHSGLLARPRVKDQETQAALDALARAVNALERVLAEYKVGSVRKAQILMPDGRECGWIGTDGGITGIATRLVQARLPAPHIGTGRTVDWGNKSAGGTDVLALESADQIHLYNFQAGSGAYTYNIDLSNAGAFFGAQFMVRISKDATTNPTIKVRNGAGGTDLISLNTIDSGTWSGVFIHDGSNWYRFLFVKDDL